MRRPPVINHQLEADSPLQAALQAGFNRLEEDGTETELEAYSATHEYTEAPLAPSLIIPCDLTQNK